MRLAHKLLDACSTAFVVAMVGVLVLLPLASAYWATKLGIDIYRAYASTTTWHSTKGVITNATITRSCGGGRGGLGHALDVTYRYEVAGQQYSGTRIWFGNGLCSSRHEVESAAAKFLPGAARFVYFDLKHPAESVLNPGTTANGTLFLFLCACAFTVAIPLLIFKGPKLQEGNGRSQAERLEAFLTRHQSLHHGQRTEWSPSKCPDTPERPTRSGE